VLPQPRLSRRSCAPCRVQELKDYFYYAQLRIQGEDITSERKAPGLIPLSEIPSMMRALGFFPSETEIQNMVRQAKIRLS
jgi:hypothetical protein